MVRVRRVHPRWSRNEIAGAENRYDADIALSEPADLGIGLVMLSGDEENYSGIAQGLAILTLNNSSK